MTTNSTLISARWVIPVQQTNTSSSNEVLDNHSIYISDGKIVDILATDIAVKKYSAANQIDKPDHALIPGLINTHTHASMNLFKGLADDVPLMDWLNNYIWPAEAKWADQQFIRDGAQLAIAEMLLSGTTCFNDMYLFPDIVANVAQEMGIRACVGMIVLDFPSVWASSVDEYFEKGIQMHDETRALSRISTSMAPHAPYTVSDEPLERVRTYADELQTQIHMHLHETRDEIKGSVDQFGVRPLARLHELGLLSPKMIAVHMTQLNDDEVNLCAETGLNIAHCPESNQKLASGTCRVNDLIEAGVNVCIGTDSASSNNDLNMLGEIRTAAFTAKNSSQNAAVLPADTALKMGTMNGAIALNMQSEIGSLSVGKQADIVAIDLNNINTMPVYNPISQIIYSASRNQVSDVWVSGSQLVRDRKLQNYDLNNILSKAKAWGDKISASI